MDDSRSRAVAPVTRNAAPVRDATMEGATGAGKASTARGVLAIVLLLMPPVVHTILFSVTVFGEMARNPSGAAFGRLDLAVFVATIAYLCCAAVLRGDAKRLSAFLTVTYFALIPLVTLELFLRAFSQGSSPTPWPPMFHRVSTAAAGVMPGIEGEIEFSTNRFGLRGPDLSLDELRNRELRILCVGGSTTECLYVTDRKSWPWRLQEELAQRLEASCFVGNAGKSGLAAINHEYLLRNYRLVPEFNLVVVMCGANDLRALLRGDYALRVANVAEHTLRVPESGAYYRRLALVRTLTAALRIRRSSLGDEVMQDPEGRWIARRRVERKQALKRLIVRHPHPGLQLALLNYRATVGRIIEICRKRGQRLIFLTQPTLCRADLPEKLRDLLLEHSGDSAYSEAVLSRMTQSFNHVLMDVCSLHKVECIDLASMLSRDTSAFYDDWHFNREGCEKIAGIISNYLARDLRGRVPGGFVPRSRRATH